jgi:hypothetical protein
MARISSYPYDTTVEDKDAWIGTQAANRRTKQFTAEAVAEYLNINAKVNIGGQMSFKWTDIQKGGAGTVSEVGGGGSGNAFSTITELFFSITELNGQNVVAFLDYIKTKNILLGQGDQISQFGHYTLDTYVIDTDPNYYKATLTYIGGNGTIVNDKQYTLIYFDIETAGDKTFVFTQAVSANPWVVVHNLDKYPSVTVTDSNVTPRVVVAQVDYDNANQVTITFAGAQAGNAYLN